MGLRPTNGHESHPSLSFRAKPRTVWCRAKRGICFSVPHLTQVHPCWISRLDQSNLLRAAPRLNLLFARDRGTNVAEVFVVHQPAHVVRGGKARKKPDRKSTR